MRALPKSPIKLQILFLICAFFIQACGGGGSSVDGSGTNTSGTISGTVTASSTISFKDSTFQAPAAGTVGVSGAICTLEGTAKSSVTDADGFFQIDDVVPGSYIVICKKTAANGKVHAFLIASEVTEDTTTNIGTIQITQAGAVQGKATLAGQSDHIGIKAFIPGTSMQATTDSLGTYLMSDIPDGTYNLHLEKNGFMTVILSDVVVTSGQTAIAGDVNLNITTGATGSITIENGQEHSNSRTVSVSINASVDAVLYQLSEDPNFIGSVWNSIPSSRTWTFDSDGDKRLFIKFSDANGLESSPVSDSIIVDTVPPTGTGVAINDGAPFTFSSTVTLNLTASDLTTFAVQMKISNDPILTDALWEPFASTKSWTFSGGEGTKTVYAKFLDAVGNESEIVSASITFTSLSSIEVSPVNSSLPVGLTQQFVAMGTSTNASVQDLTTSVNWNSSDPLVATVSSGGLVTSVSIGTAMITATDTLTNISGSTMLTIAWTTKAPMPTGRSLLATGVVNDILYAVGGMLGGGTRLATLEAYNPATDMWTGLNPMPSARAGLSVAVVSGKIYAIGGFNPNNLGTLEAYDPTPNTWETLAPMPTPRERLSTAVVNGIIYAVGGYGDGVIPLSVLEAYNPATNTWTTLAPMPTARCCLATSAAVIDGLIYVVGGADNANSAMKVLEVYNPTTDTWTTLAPMPTGRHGLAVGVINGLLYAVGGFDGGDPTTVEAYDPFSNTWTKGASMPTGRRYFSAGVINGVMYAVGGGGSSVSALTTLEAFTPP